MNDLCATNVADRRPTCQYSLNTYVGERSEHGARARYRKRRRAEQEESTRLRITEAAVDLHGSVGPARTTISAVAERAGVQRATVYRHFPDEEALFAACSAHWLAGHPLPDAGRWESIADPGARLRTALAEIYAWFERGEQMLEKTTRDVAVVPALRAGDGRFGEWFERGRRGLDARPPRARRAPAPGAGGDRPRPRLPDLALARPRRRG